MKKILWIRESVRFSNLIDLLIFLGISILAYSAHFLLKITIPKNSGNFISISILVFETMVNLYMVGSIDKLIKRLEEKHPVWYKYLPGRYLRYPELLNTNWWILGFLVYIAILAYLDYFDSIIIVILYCLLDFVIRKKYIKKAIDVSNEEERNHFLKAHEKIYVKDHDLGSLMMQGYRSETDRTDTITLFCEMFILYWKEKVKEEIDSAQDDFNLAYERIYNITYSCLEDIWRQTDDTINFNMFLIDFLKRMEILTENDETYKKYVWKTLLAAVIAFAVFEGEKLNQTEIYQNLTSKEFLKRKERASLWLWCVEFLFQYNEKKDSIGIVLMPQTLRLYDSKISFSDKKDIDFYRFLWYVWIRKAKGSLAESIINLEELIEYCLGNEEGKSCRSDAQKGAQTGSLYILIKNIQLEGEIIL